MELLTPSRGLCEKGLRVLGLIPARGGSKGIPGRIFGFWWAGRCLPTLRKRPLRPEGLLA